MSDLLRELEQAEARVSQLRQQISHSTCAEVGHDWKLMGGRMAVCSRGGDCVCSIPVCECTKCGECDYGDSVEASEIIASCELTYRDASPSSARESYGEVGHG